MGQLRVGLIAEEVEKVEPRLVGYEADGKAPRTVRYEELTSVLVGAIKGQQQQIDELKKEVEGLR